MKPEISLNSRPFYTQGRAHGRSGRFGRHMNVLVLLEIELLNLDCAAYSLVTTLTELSWLLKLNLYGSQKV